MDHPQPYSDTDPRAREVWLGLLRKMPAGDKLKLTLELSRFALQMSEMGVRSRYPEASDRSGPTDGTPTSMKSPADGVKRILEVLDKLEMPYLVGGSAASSVHGSRPAGGPSGRIHRGVELGVADLLERLLGEPEAMLQTCVLAGSQAFRLDYGEADNACPSANGAVQRPHGKATVKERTDVPKSLL